MRRIVSRSLCSVALITLLALPCLTLAAAPASGTVPTASWTATFQAWLADTSLARLAGWGKAAASHSTAPDATDPAAVVGAPPPSSTTAETGGDGNDATPDLDPNG